MNEITRHIVGSITILCMLTVFNGCGHGDGVERIPLSGTVTYKGQPVADGQIRLIPKSGTVAPITIVQITNCRYDTSSVGGAPVGQHRVEILSFDPNTPAPTGPGQPRRTQFLPDKYNKRSTLELEVKAGLSKLEQNYDLTP